MHARACSNQVTILAVPILVNASVFIRLVFMMGWKGQQYRLCMVVVIDRSPLVMQLTF